ncbi:MAG: hypothetical protein IJC82_01850 [Firmicutes bacterium]|nr:hypothetical protein [Bacillota bacterium]
MINTAEPMALTKNLFIRRMLFEEKQHLGDCGLTLEVWHQRSHPNLPVLQLTIIRRINNEKK